MGCQVVGLHNDENTALGATIHAAWSNSIEDLNKLCDKFIKINHSTLCEPTDKHYSLYNELYEHYLSLLNKEYPDFNKE